MAGIAGLPSTSPAADVQAITKAAPTTGTAPWTATLSFDARYTSFSSSNGASGWQLYLPVALQAALRPSDDWKIEFLTRSGYLSSRQTNSAGLTGQVDTPTDTSLSTTFTYLGLAGLQPFVSTNFNIPSGKTVLTGATAVARLDVDMFETPIVFGEGLNFGVTAGVNIPLTADFLVSLAAGYTWRGAYDREALVPPVPQGVNVLDPGDVFTVNASVGWQQGSWTFQASSFYSMETTTTSDGRPYFQAGNRFYAWGSVGYAWLPELSSKVSVSFDHSDNNRVLMFGLPPPVREAFNSNSDVVRVTFDTTYKFGRFAVGPTATWLHRNHNAYLPTTLEFTPAKERWSAGALATIAITEQASIRLRGERVWQHQDDKPAVVFPLRAAIPAFATDAWVVTFGGVLKI